MSEQEMIRLAQGIFEAYNGQDTQHFATLVADDMVFRDQALFPQTWDGRQAFLDLLREWWISFPDGKVTWGNYLVSGESVGCEAILEGTHRGDFYGIAATGKRVHFPFLHVMEFSDGKLKEIRFYYDRERVLKQMGVIS